MKSKQEKKVKTTETEIILFSLRFFALLCEFGFTAYRHIGSIRFTSFTVIIFIIFLAAMYSLSIQIINQSIH